MAIDPKQFQARREREIRNEVMADFGVKKAQGDLF